MGLSMYITFDITVLYLILDSILNSLLDYNTLSHYQNITLPYRYNIMLHCNDISCYIVQCIQLHNNDLYV